MTKFTKVFIATVLLLTFGWLIWTKLAKAQNNCSAIVLCGTSGSIGGGLLAIGASASGTVTVTGAQVGMVCIVQPSDGTDMVALGAIPGCTVTAANTVVVRIMAIITVTPAVKTYNVRVIS